MIGYDRGCPSAISTDFCNLNSNHKIHSRIPYLRNRFTQYQGQQQAMAEPEKDDYSERRRTIIGVILIKIATGICACWGSINLYVLSFMYNQGQSVTPATNSIIVLTAIIPMSLVILAAPRLSARFGYERTNKFCAFLFLLAPQVLRYRCDLLTVSIFGALLPCSAFAISMIPIFNCMWTRFPQSKNRVTSLAVTCFAVGTIFWNFTFTWIVNPHNSSTTVLDETTSLQYFGPEVANKVIPTLSLGYLLAGIMFVIGSFLIKKKDDGAAHGHHSKQLISVEETKDHKQQVIDRVSANVFEVRASKQRQLLELGQGTDLARGLIKSDMSLREALLDWRFVYIFLISLFSGLYQIFLVLNLKFIYMPIVGDDYFLVLCLAVSTSISIGGAFAWGYLGDRYGFVSTLLLFTVLDLGIKVFGVWAQTKLQLMLLFVGIGAVDKSMLTIMGPGLVEIFGINLATQLLPFKGISVFAGYLLSQIGYIVLSKHVTPQGYLMVLLPFSIACIFLSAKLYRLKDSHPHSNS